MGSKWQWVSLEDSEAEALAGQLSHTPPDECLVSFPALHALSLLLVAVCQILPKGVVAVLGPSSSPASSSIISNICGEKEVSSGSGWETICILEDFA